jgi:hypothetical protein
MLLSALTICLSAFLLFQVQPMIAKMILPWFGGSAALWITAMLFFQAALLGGYLYAHWLIRSLTPKVQTAVHASLLGISLLFLPIMPSLAWKPSGGEDPIVHILGILAISVGLPYFLLSTTSPLVQAWHARRHRTALPYRLFALSNLASLLGLLAYPFVVEPKVTLRTQSLGWSVAYAVFVLFGAAAAFAGTKSVAPDAVDGREVVETDAGDYPPRIGEQVSWMLFAACASTLLLSVTNHLTQNVASIPFLWVLPLGLYLLSFVLTFDLEGLYRRRIWIWLLAAALGGMSYGLATWNSRTPLKLVIPVFCAGLFVACMVCHGELVKRKPAPRYLTSFYLMMALGGSLGGLLIGVAAPRLLPGYFELPLALLGCAALMLTVIEYRFWKCTASVACLAAVAVVFAAITFVSSYRDSTRAMVRNFYGGLRVTEQDGGTGKESRTMVHGTVIHGKQFMAPERRTERITYYAPESGVGLALKSLRPGPLRVGVIGLGSGSLAAYAERGDLFRFYEINPLVEKLSREQFTYLSDCRGKTEVILGDGRLSLEREPDQHYDLLVVDAFSGDSIPVHLITRQALELYFRHLRPGGILALHVTNSHLNLPPVVETLRRGLGMYAVIITNERDGMRRVFSADWALLSSRQITDPEVVNSAGELPFRPELRAWTDDYNNLFQILK